MSTSYFFSMIYHDVEKSKVLTRTVTFTALPSFVEVQNAIVSNFEIGAGSKDGLELKYNTNQTEGEAPEFHDIGSTDDDIKDVVDLNAALFPLSPKKIKIHIFPPPLSPLPRPLALFHLTNSSCWSLGKFLNSANLW